MSTDERADYLMEAFLDEQNTLIRPLVSRKLHLIKVLDERSGIIEKILDEKRRKFLANSVMSPAAGGRKTPTAALATTPSSELIIIEKLEDELEQLATEKVTICMQLMDLVKRPFETILEVESTLRIATDNGLPSGQQPPVQVPVPAASSSSTVQRTSTTSRQSVAAPVAPLQPPDEELWCFCRRPDDGRQMVACDNPRCDIAWWHVDCLEKYIAQNHIGTIPSEDAKWMCPICIAAEIVSREEAAGIGGGEKRRRARRA